MLGKMDMDFAHLGLESGMVFETVVYERFQMNQKERNMRTRVLI